MRMISQMPHLTKICKIGMCSLGSNTFDDFQATYAYGSVVITARNALKMGDEAVIKQIPKAKKYFATIDSDNYDLSTAPSVGSPSPGSLNNEFVTDVLEGIAKIGDVVAFDLAKSLRNTISPTFPLALAP